MDDELILPGMSERNRQSAGGYIARPSFIGTCLSTPSSTPACGALTSVDDVGTAAAGRFWSYWAIWPTLWWGVGVFCTRALGAAVLGLFSQEWEDRKVKQLMQKESR